MQLAPSRQPQTHKPTPQQAAILALATAKPAYPYAQTDLASLMAERVPALKGKQELLERLYGQSGIEQRYSVLPDFKPGAEPELFKPGAEPDTSARMAAYRKHAVNLGREAAQKALQGINRQAVTHIITFSCTGQYAPGLEIDLQQVLGLRPSVQRLAINFMGCYAAFQAMRQAAAIVALQPDALVLLVGVELCTLHFKLDASRDQMAANLLFADGVSALVVGHAQQARGMASLERPLLLSSFKSQLLPAEESTMSWAIGQQGFDISLSSYVPALLESGINALIKEGLEFGASHYAIHPGGKAILDAVERALMLAPDALTASRAVLASHGNMSSVSVLYVLDRLIAVGIEGPVQAMAFGPGLTLEMAVMEPLG